MYQSATSSRQPAAERVTQRAGFDSATVIFYAIPTAYLFNIKGVGVSFLLLPPFLR